MDQPLLLEKYSMGVGDRFAHQAEAQLRACMLAAEKGVTVVPVWNKSYREHTIIGSQPSSTRQAADAAVRKLGWNKPYHVDADHINATTVDGFIDSCDFFTLDVADWIGKPADPADVKAFVDRHPELAGEAAAAGKYLAAVKEAGTIYRRVEAKKGKGRFTTEVSMDETDSPQTPAELLVILAAVADEGIPVQTIAPKFTGRFNKGVDYVGDVAKFSEEFSNDVAAIAHAVRQYDLPAEPEAERAFRQRQVLPLRADPPGPEEVRRRRACEDRRHNLAGRADRAGGGRRRGAGSG